MADLLIKAVDATHRDSTTDRACYKRGDVVLVRPTGWHWGREEVKPPAQGGKFVIVRLLRDDGVTPCWSVPDGWQHETGCPPMPAGVERLAAFVTPELDAFFLPERRRVFRVIVDSLPAGVRSTLNRDGFIALRWTAVRDFIQNKVTLATESDRVLS